MKIPAELYMFVHQLIFSKVTLLQKCIRCIRNICS